MRYRKRRDHAACSAEVARISNLAGVPVVFKSSFDKANRTSVESYRGPGLKRGLAILKDVREKTGLPIISDIHTPDQAPVAGEVLDVIQIPAFLSRQTDLLVAAGRTGRTVNIKKGQFQAPEDVEYAIKKVLGTGNNSILLTERGAQFRISGPCCGHAIHSSHETLRFSCNI